MLINDQAPPPPKKINNVEVEKKIKVEQDSPKNTTNIKVKLICSLKLQIDLPFYNC